MTENETPIRQILETAIQNIKNLADVNTIVGAPIVSNDGTTVVPVSKLSLGFASGGSDFATKEQATRNKTSFGGGGGAGVSITPVAFLVVSSQGDVSLLPVGGKNDAAEAFLEALPDLVHKIKELLDKNKKA